MADSRINQLSLQSLVLYIPNENRPVSHECGLDLSMQVMWLVFSVASIEKMTSKNLPFGPRIGQL